MFLETVEPNLLLQCLPTSWTGLLSPTLSSPRLTLSDPHLATGILSAPPGPQTDPLSPFQAPAAWSPLPGPLSVPRPGPQP